MVALMFANPGLDDEDDGHSSFANRAALFNICIAIASFWARSIPTAKTPMTSRYPMFFLHSPITNLSFEGSSSLGQPLCALLGETPASNRHPTARENSMRIKILLLVPNAFLTS